MDKLEKVIKRLECCMINPDLCDRTNCPYAGEGDESDYCDVKLIKDAIALLKAPIAFGEWVEEPDRVNHYHCSNCGVVWGVMSKAMKYCPSCAAKMMNSPMWEVEGNNGKDA